MPFLSAESLCLDDALNSEIWQDSPSVQLGIQSQAQLTAAGTIGAQQAMLPDGEVLPWVPDLLGRHWQDEEAVLIVGSAYAGFVREFSTRHSTMPLTAYREAKSMEQFQKAFVRCVVEPDSDYYGPLWDLLRCAGAASQGRFALLDMCRVSFVRRGREPHRNDTGGDAVVQQGASIYERYVEDALPSEWTWRRLTDGRATRIVSLGTIAEHGLLRLFAARRMRIRDHATGIELIRRNEAGGKWVLRYADPRLKLSSRLLTPTWWDVEGEVAGTTRRWSVLPVFHPARNNADRRYALTAKVLASIPALD